MPPRSNSRHPSITQGRAMVQMVEAAQVLLTNPNGWAENLRLKLSLALYQHRLRGYIAALPPGMAAEIQKGGKVFDGKQPLGEDI